MKNLHRIGRYTTFVEELHAAIESLLQNDEDMAAMYLSDKIRGRPRSVEQHQELEMLLETYFTRLEDTIARFKEIRNAARAPDTAWVPSASPAP